LVTTIFRMSLLPGLPSAMTHTPPSGVFAPEVTVPSM
jgi:hypothetical protein